METKIRKHVQFTRKKLKRYKQFKRLKPSNDNLLYIRISRILDGAVIKTMKEHPEYFSKDKPKSNIRASIIKRAAKQLHQLCLEEVKNRGMDSTIKED